MKIPAHKRDIGRIRDQAEVLTKDSEEVGRPFNYIQTQSS